MKVRTIVRCGIAALKTGFCVRLPPVVRQTNVNTLPTMQTKTIVKFGIAALAMESFFGVSLPVRAEQLVWVKGPALDYFKVAKHL